MIIQSILQVGVNSADSTEFTVPVEYPNNIFYKYYSVLFFNLFNFANWKDLNSSNNEIEVYSFYYTLILLYSYNFY